jgi:hypothetical protein
MTGSTSLKSSKKIFSFGFLTGFIVGIFSVIIISFGAASIILTNPHGNLAKYALSKAHYFTGILGPLVSVKHLALNTISKLNDPELKIKYPLSFQEAPFSGTRIEKSGSFVSWIAPFSDRVPKDEIPPHFKINRPGKGRPISLIGLKGETLSFQVILRSEDSLDNLHISIEPGPTSSSCIIFHRFEEIYLKIVLNQGTGLKKMFNPDPLIPFSDPYTAGHRVINSISVKKGENQPIWVDATISEHCQAGDYSANLFIRNNGKILRKSKIKIHIVGIELPKHSGLERWIELYMGRFYNGEPISNDQILHDMLSKYFIISHEYGFSTNGCVSIGPNIQWDKNTYKINSIDWTRYDYLLGDILSGKLTGSPPNAWCLPLLGPYTLGTVGGFTYMSGTPSDISDWNNLPRKIAIEETRAIVKHWKDKGWPLDKTLAYIWDEPLHQIYYPYIYKLIGNIASAIHYGSDHQIPVMVTDSPYIWDRHEPGHHKDDMYHYIDIWSPSSITYIPDKIRPYQDEGKKAWFYQGEPPFIASSDILGHGPGFRMWFWTAWKYKVNGLFYWAGDFWSGNEIGKNPYTHGGTEDGVIFYPGHQLHFLGLPDINGPVPSIRMAQWRRGYEDYRYLLLLKRKGKSSEINTLVNTLIPKALNEGGYFPYWRTPLWHRPGDWNHDPKIWHETRVKLAKEIEKLYGSSTTTDGTLRGVNN